MKKAAIKLVCVVFLRGLLHVMYDGSDLCGRNIYICHSERQCDRVRFS